MSDALSAVNEAAGNADTAAPRRRRCAEAAAPAGVVLAGGRKIAS
jgi:hypothetical protein